MWTQAQLVSGFLALPASAQTTLTSAMNVLNSQTIQYSVPQSDIEVGSIQGVLLLDGDWLNIMAATGLSGEIGNLAQRAVQLVEGQARSIRRQDWGTFLQLLGVLESANLITSGSYAAVQGLATMSGMVWNPAIQLAQLQEAQRDGLIPGVPV